MLAIQEVKALYSQAQYAITQSNLIKARKFLNQLLSLDSSFLPAWHLLADSFSIERQPLEARETIKRATKVFGENQAAISALQIHLASLYLKEGELAAAAATIELPALLTLQNWQMLSRAGYIFMLCEEHQLAMTAYSSALSINDKDPELLFNTASAHRAMGNLDKAEKLYSKAILASERNFPAYKLRSDLRKQTLEDNHVNELIGLTRKPYLSDEAKVHVYFALAKELEDMEKYNDSFSALTKGASLRRKSISYSIESDINLLNTIAKTYSEETIKSKQTKSELGNGIIFILGMPRTGSTLIDRLLSSSPTVASAGEPNTLARLLYTASARASGKSLNHNSNATELIRATADIDFSEIGSEYERLLLARGKHKGAQYIIDKNPSNFLYLGAIHLALPRAKIIHVARDPMDTCYAIYKALFKNAHPYSYNLTELGRYYCAYRKLMAHWSTVLPNSYHDIEYESFVANQATESKKLFNHCNLEWSEKYLDFHKNAASGTSTASAAQVRQPVYKSSIGKWKKYREHLKPLEEIINTTLT